MEAVSRTKAVDFMKTPVAAGQTFNAGSGQPLAKSTERERTGDSLMKMLEDEVEQPAPQLESAERILAAAGRPALSPGPDWKDSRRVLERIIAAPADPEAADHARVLLKAMGGAA